LGLDEDCILLSGSHGNVAEAVTAYKAKLWKHHKDVSKYRYDVGSLNMITEFDFSSSDSIFSNHLEQLAVLCPNLRRLNLRDHTNCLKDLQGLRAIAHCCHHLQGLNLIGIQVTEIESNLQLWEILSDMKLTHLAIELCVIIPFENDGLYKQNLIRLYQKCSLLQALQLKRDKIVRPCPKCEAYNDNDCLVLSHFPSLTLCSLEHMPFKSNATMRNAVASCKELKYLKYSVFYNLDNDHPVLFSCNLQQLVIDCSSYDISNEFMHIVSAHGDLVHVLFYVQSMTHEGIFTLLMNSPKLLTFYAAADCLSRNLMTPRINNAEALRLFYWKKFPNKKLFTAGTFTITNSHSSFGHQLFVSHIVKLNIDIVPMWN